MTNLLPNFSYIPRSSSSTIGTQNLEYLLALANWDDLADYAVTKSSVLCSEGMMTPVIHLAPR